MMMKPSTLLIVLSLLVLHLTTPSHAAGESLHTMCNFVGGDYVNYDYCVAALSSNPNSTTADSHTLAVISVNLTAANATAVRSRADALAREATDPFVKASLLNCSALYAAATPDLRRSADDAAGRNYSSAVEVLAAVLRVPAGCDETFMTRDGAVSPIRKENNAFSDLTTLAKAINNYMAQ